MIMNMQFFKIYSSLLLCLVVAGNVAALNNKTRSQLYELVGTSHDLLPEVVSSVCQARSHNHCAVKCISSDTCKSYSVQDGNTSAAECRLSDREDSPMSYKLNSKVYKVIMTSNGDKSELSTATETVTTTQGPPSCANPAIINQLYNCGSTPTFSSTGIIKLRSNRALVFMTNNTYLRCSSMDDIVMQGARPCGGPYDIVGDSGLDPSSTIFTSGPPTAGVGFIQSNMADCRYYLFKGDTVYCYQHTDDNSYKPWMKPCTTGWASMNIQSRFGAGIPSDPDDVIGNLHNTHDFYFLKRNTVYKSTGDSTSGALVAGFPKPLHDVFPDIMCDITAATEGYNTGDYYSVVGNKLYFGKSGTVYDKDKLCHNT